MDASTLVSLVICCCLCIFVGDAFPINECESDESCITIESCTLLADVIEKLDTNVTIRKFIRNKHCGFQSLSPKLCCPNSISSSRSDQGPELTTMLDPPCGRPLKDHQERIIGGNGAPPGDWPWIAALLYRHDNDSEGSAILNCGGTLISRRHILTAAHCELGGKQLVEVRLGDTDQYTEEDCLDTGTICYCEKDCLFKSGKECVENQGCAPKHQTYTKFTSKTHPEFRQDASGVMHNDLTIIILDQPVVFSDYVIPVCLPDVEVGDELAVEDNRNIVVGWGSTSPGYEQPKGAEVLQMLEVLIFEQDQCREKLKNFIHGSLLEEGHLCAGSNKTGQAACRGDSGGPLVSKSKLEGKLEGNWVLEGVTSFGISYCGHKAPTVFTRVTKYVPWIRSIMSEPDP